MNSRSIRFSVTVTLSLLVLLMLFLPVMARGEVAAPIAPRPPLAVEAVSPYSFITTTTTYTEITGGTLHGSGTAVDDSNYNAVSIGFTFTYNKVNYTQIGINSNGFVRLGGTAFSTSCAYTPISSSDNTNCSNVIAALAEDQQGNTGGTLRSELLGIAPNRVLVIQWKDFRHYNVTSESFNYQIRLYETTNVVELVYGPFTKNATNRTDQVGLRGATNADFNNKKTTTATTGSWNSPLAGTSNLDAMGLTTSLYPASGLVYQFTPPLPAPDLSASTKTVSPSGTRFTGEVLTYTIGIVNSGDLTSTATALSDPIPAGTTYIPGSAQLTGTGTLTATASSIDWTGGLGLSERVTVTFQVTLTAQSGSVTNTATISDPLAFAPVVKSVNTPIQVPNYSTSTKAVAPTGTRFTGETLYYTVTVINSGLMTGTASLSDPVPAGTAYVPGSAAVQGGGSLSDVGNVINWTGTVSASNRVTVTYQAVLTAVNGSVTNTATISDPLISAAVVKTVNTVVAVPNYSTSTKVAVPAAGSLVNTGDYITYTVTLINSGLVTGTAALSDPIPAGVTYVPGSAAALGGGTLLADSAGITWTGNISVSGRITVTFSAQVTALNGAIANTATISDPVTLAPVTKSTSHTVRSPIFSTSTKTASAVAALPGAALTYTIRIVNSGALSATNATMTDVLPPEFFPDLNGITASSGSVVTNTWPMISWSGVVTDGATIIVTIPGTIDPAVCGITIANSAIIADPLAATYTATANTVVYGPITMFSESFDGVTFPPTGWSQQVITTSATAPNWTRETVTINPAGVLPFSGAGLARFNSYSASAGAANRLGTPSITLTANTNPVALFYVYHDSGFTGANDRIQPQVSTNGGASWVDVGTPVSRYDGSLGWKPYAVDLSAYQGQAVQLGFLAISAFGNDIHIDAVSVRTCCEAPAGVSFVFAPTSPLSGQSVDFTATVLTGTAPLTYTWNFGDGSPIGSGNPIAHSYAASGTFNVTLTVDCKCGTTSVAQQVNVSDAPTPPDLDNVQSSSPTALGTATYLTGTLLAGSAPITYTWDFGDGTGIVDGLTLNHTYTQSGLYVVSLTADNVAGSDVVTTTVDVGVAPTASFDATNPTYYPNATTFTYTGNPGTGPTAYLWTLSNGVTSTLDSFTATLAAPAPINNYTSTLRVSNPYGVAVTNTVITVLNISADLSISKSDSPDPAGGTQALTYTLAISNFGPNALIGAPGASFPFTNTGLITIPASGTGTPYPSAIDVAGITDLVGQVKVTLYNITHTYPDDIQVMLVSPAGQAVLLMANAGGSSDINNVTLTFDDNASSLPDSTQITSGTYKPTYYGTPGFVGPYATKLSALAGANPNGAWGLYVADIASPDSGVIAGGWSLELTTVQPVTTTVVDTLPAGYTFGSAGGSGWTCGNGSGTVTCTRGILPVGAAPVIVITGNAPFLATSGDITNTATVSSVLPDFSTLNNTATITTFVNALQSDLAVFKTDSPDPVGVGGTVTYQITVTNNGPDATTSVVAVDTLPASFQFASASAGCANAAGTVTCAIGSLSNGQSAYATVVVTATALGTYTNTVTVSSANPDLVAANNTATAATTVASPEIGLNPTSLGATHFPNVVTTQTLTISNTGPVALNWNILESVSRQEMLSAESGVAIAGKRALSADPNLHVIVENTLPRTTAPLVLINDGSFENATSAWTEVDTTGCTPWIGDWFSIVGVTAYNGTQYFWAGGYCGAANSNSATQSLLVPASTPVLSFYYRANRSDPDSATNGSAYIKVNGTTVWSLAMVQANNTTVWTKVTVDLSAYAGQTVALALGANNVGTGIGNVFFDYLEWNAASCSANALSWLTALPTSGTTNPGGSSTVNVQFDSTGLSSGVYTGTLCVNSNDATDLVRNVPVTLTVSPQYTVTFVYHDVEDVVQAGEQVYIAGTFNGWNANAQALTADAGNTTFTATLNLGAGAYEYKYIVKSGGDQWDWLNTNNRAYAVAGAATVNDYRNVTVGYAHLIGPATLSGIAGQATAPITSEVYINNVTNPAGLGRGVKAETGFGLPATAIASWQWSSSNYSGQNGNNDVLTATVTPAATGVYSYAARFDGNWGAGNPNAAWTYGDLNGSNPFDITKTGVLTVQSACQPIGGLSFTANPVAPRSGQSVLFTASVATGTLPVTYTWDFGDSGTGNGSPVNHTFPAVAAATAYTVTLTANNACPSQAQASQVIVVNPHTLYLPLIWK
jgi:uncharacterized repeat protein (TIGR01451 family)